MAASNNYNFIQLNTQDKVLAFYQNPIISTYIAPYRNKNIDGVLNHDAEHSIYYGLNYNYGSDAIIEYDNIIIDTEVQEIVWKDM